jgi:hypothetical protein
MPCGQGSRFERNLRENRHTDSGSVAPRSVSVEREEAGKSRDLEGAPRALRRLPPRRGSGARSGRVESENISRLPCPAALPGCRRERGRRTRGLRSAHRARLESKHRTPRPLATPGALAPARNTGRPRARSQHRAPSPAPAAGRRGGSATRRPSSSRSAGARRGLRIRAPASFRELAGGKGTFACWGGTAGEKRW